MSTPPARQPNGHWVAGTTGNPLGRRPKAIELAYLLAAREEVPTQEWRALVRAQAEIAAGGPTIKPIEQTAAFKVLKDLLLPGVEAPTGDRVTFDPSRASTAELEALRATMRKMVVPDAGEPVDVTPEPRR